MATNIFKILYTDDYSLCTLETNFVRLIMGRKGYYAIKVDLEKAYYCLNWNSIKDTLIIFGFHFDLVHLIMDCISSTSFRVI